MKLLYRHYNMIGTLFKYRRLLPDTIRRPAIRSIVNKQAKEKNPLYTITYFVTNRCCLKCAHCFYRNETEKNLELLSLAEVSKLCSSLKGRIGHIVLTGGEPLLRPDLKERARIFWEVAGTRVATIVTSGYLPDRLQDTLYFLMNQTNMAVNVHFSMDGPESLHNSIRGDKDAFSNMIKSFATMQEMRKRFGRKRIPFVHLVTTLSKKNRDLLSEIVEIGRGFSGIEHSFTFMRGSHAGTLNVQPDLVSDFDPLEKLFLDTKEMERCFETLEKLVWNRKEVGFYERLNREAMRLRIKFQKNKPIPGPCHSGYWSLILYPNGDIARCEMLKPIGNIRETDCNIPAFMALQKTSDFFKVTKSCSCCHECNLVHNVKIDEDSLCRLFS